VCTYTSIIPILLLSSVIWYVPVQIRTLVWPSLKVFKYYSHELTSRDAWKGLPTIVSYSAIKEDITLRWYVDMLIYSSTATTKDIDYIICLAAQAMWIMGDSCPQPCAGSIGATIWVTFYRSIAALYRYKPG
jgi:hypothetical protein